MRIAVAIYLVFATAVGPWPCCCAMPRSACRIAGPERSGSNGPPSCCHAVKTRPAESQSPGAARVIAGEQTHDGQTPASCPCGISGCAAKARPDQARPTTSHSETPEPTAAGGGFVGLLPTAAIAATTGCHRKPWCVADRLNGHCVLRC